MHFPKKKAASAPTNEIHRCPYIAQSPPRRSCETLAAPPPSSPLRLRLEPLRNSAGKRRRNRAALSPDAEVEWNALGEGATSGVMARDGWDAAAGCFPGVGWRIWHRPPAPPANHVRHDGSVRTAHHGVVGVVDDGVRRCGRRC